MAKKQKTQTTSEQIAQEVRELHVLIAKRNDAEPDPTLEELVHDRQQALHAAKARERAATVAGLRPLETELTENITDKMRDLYNAIAECDHKAWQPIQAAGGSPLTGVGRDLWQNVRAYLFQNDEKSTPEQRYKRYR